ncbi:hypothetical protein L209DRAFT_683868 [Thermothelomyces heterothallicus CBS 203.75]
MVALSGAALPVTPDKNSRDKIEIEKVVRKLNTEYGVGIQIPDPTLSPNERRNLGSQDEQFARWDRIHRGIQFLYYQRGDVLEQALCSFFSEAKAASLRWARKPRANPGTFPSTRTPSKVQTADQQENLQNILIKVINDYKARMTPSLRLPKPSGAAVVARPGDESDASSPKSASEPPSSASSKRSFDRDDDHEFKRPRAQEFSALRYQSPALDALDNVPSRRRLGGARTDWSPERRRVDEEPGISSIAASSSSSSSNVSSLFSHSEGQQLSQTTQDEDVHEKRLLATRGLAFSPPLHCDLPRRSAPQASAFEELGYPVQHPSQRSSTSSGDGSGFAGSSNASLGKTLETPRSRGDRLSEARKPSAIHSRLQNIWPKFPAWLHDAPLAIAWEITRICLHCKVDLEDSALKYDPSWASSDMLTIWKSLMQLDVFRGKSFPERPSAEVFAAALTSFESRGNAVVMSATLEFNPEEDGPLFLLDMRPLQFDEGCRLTRRFGPDRFLEVLIPSPTALNAPPIIKKTEGAAEEIIRWLTQQPHFLVGRQWQAFFSKDAGYRKPAKDFTLGPDAKAIYKERVHFFAESGPNFRPVVIRARHDIPTDTVQQRTQLKVSQMLDWLLQLESNREQPYLKLFSRIQLGLSKTTPTVTFEPGQIIHRPEDILSPTKKVMNDGIGRMSRSVARKIRDLLGLTDIPSAIQGRIGSAKGMWLMDVTDHGDADWIETYPSQRKWNCDDADDPFHRTLEVRKVASELKPASLNLQFLPVLEDRAIDKEAMRCAISNRLLNDLAKQFEDQKTALNRPLQFRQWVNENSNNNRPERVKHGQVPFLGGLPADKNEILTLLMNSGFDPKSQRYLRDLAWELQKQKCDTLRTKLNIKVGRSAYIYMVADFWGILEENEVHVGFSSKFRDELDGVSYTLLADCDVLVARSPAHFVSDIQKVRAVFNPELHALKDVIVFSTKGDIPLADKLSGGDYDGDLAWVCWDPEIVDNFENAEVPVEPDLSAYLRKDKTTFDELVCRTGKTGRRACHDAVYDMIDKSFQFAMQPNYLGICTNYKERLCYYNNSVSDEGAVLLSSLLGKLVDQSKQGIIFTADSWDRLRRDKFPGKMYLDDPAYKGNHWSGPGEPSHIIDYLRFSVANPAIDHELQSLHESMGPESSAGASDGTTPSWDPDLTTYYEHLKGLANDTRSRSLKSLLDALQRAIGSAELEWKRTIFSRSSTLSYPDRVKKVYAKWLEIDFVSVSSRCSHGIGIGSKLAGLLEQPFLAERGAGATSYWALLKASTAFKLYYNTSPKFVWQMAGYQLAFIKAQVSSGVGGMPVLVTPLMYAGLATDGRFVKQYVARMEGDGSQYHDAEGGRDSGDEFEWEDDVN